LKGCKDYNAARTLAKLMSSASTPATEVAHRQRDLVTTS